MYKYRVTIERKVTRSVMMNADALKNHSQPFTAEGAERAVQGLIAFDRLGDTSKFTERGDQWKITGVESVESPDAVARLSAIIAAKFEVDIDAVTVFWMGTGQGIAEISDISITLESSDTVSSGLGFNPDGHAKIILWAERYLSHAGTLHRHGTDTEKLEETLAAVKIELDKALDECLFVGREAAMLMKYRKRKGLIK